MKLTRMQIKPCGDEQERQCVIQTLKGNSSRSTWWCRPLDLSLNGKAMKLSMIPQRWTTDKRDATLALCSYIMTMGFNESNLLATGVMMWEMTFWIILDLFSTTIFASLYKLESSTFCQPSGCIFKAFQQFVYTVFSKYFCLQTCHPCFHFSKMDISIIKYDTEEVNK